MEYVWEDTQETGLLWLPIGRENEEQEKDLLSLYTLRIFVPCACIHHSNK